SPTASPPQKTSSKARKEAFRAPLQAAFAFASASRGGDCCCCHDGCPGVLGWTSATIFAENRKRRTGRSGQKRDGGAQRPEYVCQLHYTNRPSRPGETRKSGELRREKWQRGPTPTVVRDGTESRHTCNPFSCWPCAFYVLLCHAL
ncbi:hypothetical protein B0H63DRAFT_505137, partial [Podospora didyma]